MSSTAQQWPITPAAAAPQGPAAAGPVLFQHIPKTAGTSFLTILRNLFGDANVLRVDAAHDRLGQQVALAMRARGAQLSCITGHVPLHVWRPYLPRLQPFTMLRDPVARVQSLYRFLRRAAPAELAELGLTPGFDFDTFLACTTPGTFAQVRDGMCRMLSGNPALTDGEAADFADPAAIGRGLDAAIAFLENSDFGLVEEMPATLALLRARWHLPLAIEECHVNATDPGAEELSPASVRRIVELNAADIALYQAARRLFHARTAHLDPDTHADSRHVWAPAIGVETGISDIPGRQGFHDHEPDNGFAWLMSEAPARLAFLPPAGATQTALRLELRLYAIVADYPAADLRLTLNGQPLTSEVFDRDGQWWLLSTPPLHFGAGVQTLVIEAPYHVPVRHLQPGSADRRALGLALCTVAFLP